MSSVTPWCRLGGSETLPAEQVKTICIIGAGSSGLVAANHLREAGYEVTMFEKAAGMGGAFVSKAYDNSRLVSSSYLTAFSDLRMKTDKPHLSLDEYTAYLHQYAEKFRIAPLIRFSTNVIQVSRRGAGYAVRVEPAPTEFGCAAL